MPGNRVWVSTFHSLGARLLRQYADRLGLDRNFTIYDMDDRNKLVKDALDARGIDNVKFSPERIGGAISKAKNQLHHAGAVRAHGERLLHADRGEGLPRLREAAARRQRAGLRRPAVSAGAGAEDTTRSCAPNWTPGSATC